LKAYFNQIQLPLFKKLFPAHNNDIEEMDLLFNDLIKHIMQVGRFSKNPPKIKLQSKYDKKTILKLLLALNSEFLTNLNLFDNNSNSVIKDHLLSSDNLMKCFDILNQ
jgi:hypothetical protein